MTTITNTNQLHNPLETPYKATMPNGSHDLLGNLANISSTTQKTNGGMTDKHTLAPAQNKRQNRFFLLDNARRILRNHNTTTSRSDNPHRTRHCLAVRYDNNEDIGILLNDNPERSEATVQNLVTCGSICSCPVCAHRIMLEKATDIKKALIYAENNGLVPILLTLTAQHSLACKLIDFIQNFKSAWRMFASGRQWREFKENFGIEHYITAREVTRARKFTKDNGWHYHMHILLFVNKQNLLDNDAIPNIEYLFRNRWIHCLNKNGLNGIPDIACDLRAGKNVGQQYLTKLGLTQNAKGDLDYELTGSENKGKTIWDILRDASFGDIDAEYLYLEYVQVMTGENWITFSHGFKALIEDIELETNESESSMTLWYWISQENWNVVVRNNRVGHLLKIASKYRCRDKVREFIETLKDKDYE